MAMDVFAHLGTRQEQVAVYLQPRGQRTHGEALPRLSVAMGDYLLLLSFYLV